MTDTVRDRALAATRAVPTLANLDAERRSAVLRDLAGRLRNPEIRKMLLEANAEDMADARVREQKGELAPALVKRLELKEAKLDGLADGLEQLADADELVNQVTVRRELDDGLVLTRISCPIGVLGIVFEARPDAVPQITGLAIKSGNAVLLKGGSEAIRSNAALVAVIHHVLREHDLDPSLVTLLEDRAAFRELLDLDDLVDLVIARGSGKFVQMVMDTTKIPVMGHAEGLCHLYLHGDAEPGMAAGIAADAKTDYPAACNAVETLLWHPDAAQALDASVKVLQALDVELRGDAATRERHPQLSPATDDDWKTEYSGLTLSIKQVPGLDAALDHIATHGSKHTEVIVTGDAAAAEKFIERIDAANIFHNASSRFADGYRYGLGAEVGISTGKLHARGPVGVEGLLSYRWLLRGSGQVAGDYGPRKRAFKHKDL